MQIPTVPLFVANEVNVNHLQQLSNVVSFLTVANNIPQFRSYKTASASIPAATWTTVTFGTNAPVDTDSVFLANTQGATINTQGYYEMECCLPFTEEATGANTIQIAFLLTVGNNNPHYAANTAIRFGGNADLMVAGTGTDYTYCLADVCPVVLFPGDYIVVQVWATVAVSTSTLTNSTATAGWFVPTFSGRWIRIGS